MNQPVDGQRTSGRMIVDVLAAILLVLLLGAVALWDLQRSSREVASLENAGLLAPRSSAEGEASPGEASGEKEGTAASNATETATTPPALENPPANDPPSPPEPAPQNNDPPQPPTNPPPADPSPAPMVAVNSGKRAPQVNVPPPPPPPKPEPEPEPEPEPPPEPAPPPVVVQKLLTDQKLNEFGNPEGDKYGLSRKGEFAGARLLVWTPEVEVEQNIYTSDNPLWETLSDSGFTITRQSGTFQPQWLDAADQLWIFAGRTRGLNDADLMAIEKFVRSGKGLYLAADNQPYLLDANLLAQRLFQTQITGDYPGGKIIAVRGGGITQQDFAAAGGMDKFVKGGNAPPGVDATKRLQMIQRATHYAEPHPLLTDVNFIFEGVTISNLAPTDRLATVLTASDGLILAAVARDKSLRVILDCGWTRYYYTPQHRFITETAGTLRYAENIAAYLMGKDARTEDFRGWKQRRELLAKYKDLPEQELIAALRQEDPNERWAAAATAVERKLPIFDDWLRLLADPDGMVRQQARVGLTSQAVGVDFGPSPNADEKAVQQAVRDWRGWLLLSQRPELRKATTEQLLESLVSADADERWLAAQLIRQKRLPVTAALLKAVSDPELAVRQEVRRALTVLAGDQDLGPADDADAAAIEQAAAAWKRLFAERSEKGAAGKLRLAKQLLDDKPEAARKWLREIVAQFPGTMAAAEAQELLGE
ncbi:MAG: hypothetical protein U0935_17375 [Pirellulales bacterium]